MVVECIGLPGSGKTYLFRAVEEELRRRGIPCVNGAERSMNRFEWKAAKKVLHRTIFLHPDARRMRGSMRSILSKTSGTEPLKSRYGINRDERFTLESAAIFAAAYRKMEKSEKVYLFDEGLVHTIVKFCAEFHLPEETFLEMLAVCCPKREGARIVIHNEISVDECVASIRKRDRHICEFDELPEDRLRELLEQYVRLNACYAANYPVTAVRRSEEEEEKRRRICEEILRVRTFRTVSDGKRKE